MDGDDVEDSDEEDDALPLPSGTDLNVVRNVVQLLRPLYDTTNVFQADTDTSSISVIIPQIYLLLCHLKPGPLTVTPRVWRRGDGGKLVMAKPAEEIQEADVPGDVQVLREKLLGATQKRFGSGSALDVKGLIGYYYMATFLDRRKRDLPTIQYANPTVSLATRAFMADAGARLVQWDDQRQEQHRQQEQGQQQQHQQGGGGAGLVMGVVTAEEAEYLMHAALAGGNTVGGGTTDDAPRPRGPAAPSRPWRSTATLRSGRWTAGWPTRSARTRSTPSSRCSGGRSRAGRRSFPTCLPWPAASFSSLPALQVWSASSRSRG